MKFKLNNLFLAWLPLCSIFLPNTVLADSTKPLEDQPGFDMGAVEKGRYLARIAGCNDCHTAGYLPTNGNIPVQQWLAGDGFGWRGPWGTTYGTNLRLFVADLTEEQWVETAKTLKRRPRCLGSILIA